MAETRIEWGVQLTWPDGRTGVYHRVGRASAEQMANWYNNPLNSRCAARLVSRVVTVSDWSAVPVESPTIHPSSFSVRVADDSTTQKEN